MAVALDDRRLGRLSKEDFKSKASLGYILRYRLKQKEKRQTQLHFPSTYNVSRIQAGTVRLCGFQEKKFFEKHNQICTPIQVGRPGCNRNGKASEVFVVGRGRG